MTRSPNFANLQAVLEHRRPDRPTLFEFFLNERLYDRLGGPIDPMLPPELGWRVRMIRAFAAAGYDYVTISLPNFSFPGGEQDHARTISQNDGAVIRSWDDLRAYPWPDPDQADYSMLDQLAEYLPEGMKIILHGPSGTLENAISLVGYENLCLLLADDPQLADAVCSGIGERLLAYYTRAAQHPTIGACISNDDWGFKTGTLFSPRDMRRYIFPWHKRIVSAVHAAGKPAILHSCGYFQRVMDDIVNDMQFDGRHSYEDAILPVEDAYEMYSDRIAILGGIDVDFVCRAEPQEVYARSKAILQRAETRGSYALGTGNSVPDYVPDDGYFAMTRAAIENI